MIPIEEIAEAFGRTYANAKKDKGRIPLILKNPQFLAKVVESGEKRRLENAGIHGIPVPRFCIFSVTWDCNLECIGCYAKGYSTKGTLTGEDIGRIATEASDLGSFIFIIAGGEPLMVPGLVEILGKVEKSLFFIFTNGLLIDDDVVSQLKKTRNIIPIISIEGDPYFNDYRRGTGVSEKLESAMKKLWDSRIGFGFSSMATRKNVRYITSREWFDRMWDYGARFGFIIDYIPHQADLDTSLILTDEDMAFKKSTLAVRNSEARPAVVNFPPDEYEGQSCQSAGRGLIHINADGYVEPCPFSHYAADNIKDKSLIDILGSSFMCDIRNRFEHEPFGRTCMLFEHEIEVEAIAGKSGAFRTDKVKRETVKPSVPPDTVTS